MDLHTLALLAGGILTWTVINPSYFPTHSRQSNGGKADGKSGGVPASVEELERLILVHQDELGSTFLVSTRDGSETTAVAASTAGSLLTLRSCSKASLKTSGKEALALK